MAKSPSHILGELIGNFFEDAMKEPIEKFSKEYDLYFDNIGPRKARKGKKITWTDIDGNKHDLDYVLEKGGTEHIIGKPVAFIELAWRRYTRHSKNKVQEISGAINPIVERFEQTQPFKGAILSGEFTSTSLEQLRSQGFSVLYIPFKTLVSVFERNGLNINFDEDTSENELNQIVENWKDTPNEKLNLIKEELLKECSNEIEVFKKALSSNVNRQIENIYILPLHGRSVELASRHSAIEFIGHYTFSLECAELQYIDIIVKYTNGSNVECHFKTKEQAIDFLKIIR